MALVPFTPIIGREQPIRFACNLLGEADIRLVTLTGPGGVGKTRLALEVLAVRAARGNCDVASISLAPLRDPELVLPTVATMLGVDHTGTAPLPRLIAEYVGEKPLLLLLDNMEHLPAATSGIAELLASCSTLKVLATSRSPLHIKGEHIIDVPPLALPDLSHLPPLAALAHIEAVELFVERARAIDPGFQINADNAASIATICARLDGLPLAIELAAARLQVLSLTSLLERLTHRLDLLTRGSRTLPERHQTLRAAIDWSYEQLPAPDQGAFERLAVFAGGFDLAAAEYVVGGGATSSPLSSQAATSCQTMDALSELLENALLRREVIAGEPRFMMLETIREYALERLEASGDAADAQRRHAEYFTGLAEEAEPALSIGQLSGQWPNRLEGELANLRVALTWSLSQEDPKLGLRLAAALVWFWWIRGHLVEGSEWLESALLRSREDQSALRSKLLDGAGRIARTRGEFDRAKALHNESLCIAAHLNDDVAMTRALSNLAMVIEAKGDIDQATTLFERALGLARQGGQAEVLATILTNYGLMKLTHGDQQRGVALLEEGLIIARGLGPSGLLGAILSNLGDARLEQGDQAASAAMYRECLILQSELGNQVGIADALLGIATIAVTRGDFSFATRLLASAQALYDSIRASLSLAVMRLLDNALHEIRSVLDEDTFSAEWESGRNADLQTVIAEALELEFRPSKEMDQIPANPYYSGLTSREMQVLRLVAEGYSNREIADTLFISPQTAATHVKRLRAKIGASSRAAAAAHAHRHGLVQMGSARKA
ncbi:MAG TPA: LuxR C-terminal-related transcriptional regulator [Thermomicrobiales bacterium]|nr:LuxR C-terminal-related transcriptional regulator [Thermomicrobiales bacterium]